MLCEPYWSMSMVQTWQRNEMVTYGNQFCCETYCIAGQTKTIIPLPKKKHMVLSRVHSLTSKTIPNCIPLYFLGAIKGGLREPFFPGGSSETLGWNGNAHPFLSLVTSRNWPAQTSRPEVSTQIAMDQKNPYFLYFLFGIEVATN